VRLAASLLVLQCFVAPLKGGGSKGAGPLARLPMDIGAERNYSYGVGLLIEIYTNNLRFPRTFNKERRREILTGKKDQNF
jgi:hypothetical protein